MYNVSLLCQVHPRPRVRTAPSSYSQKTWSRFLPLLINWLDFQIHSCCRQYGVLFSRLSVYVALREFDAFPRMVLLHALYYVGIQTALGVRRLLLCYTRLVQPLIPCLSITFGHSLIWINSNTRTFGEMTVVIAIWKVKSGDQWCNLETNEPLIF